MSDLQSVPPPVEDAELERLIRHYGDCCYHADDAVGLPSSGVAEAESALRSRITQLQQEAFQSGRDSVLAGQSQ